MSKSKSIRTGFQTAITSPAVVAAEITWRWLFGLLAWSLAFFALLAWLHSIKVTDADLLGLGFSPLAPAAVEHIMHGSGPMLVRAAGISLAAAIVLWGALATLGRTAILRALTGRASFAPIFGITAVRALFAAIAAGIYLLCAIAFVRLTGHGHGGLKLLLIALVLLTSWLWSMTAWQLELASVIAAADLISAPRAISRALELSRTAARQFLWVSIAIGALRFMVALGAWSVFASVFSIAVQAPRGTGWAALAAAVLVWSIFDDFLHIWRLAAYARIVAWSCQRPAAEPGNCEPGNLETAFPTGY